MKKRVISALLAVLMVVTMLPVTALGVGNYGVNLGSAAYQTNVNPFFASGYGGRSSDGYDGECTWYAWGRAYEKLGVSLPCRGNATGWTTEAANAGYSTGTTARANSIMVEHYSPYGHVFFVEKVENGYAYVTEGNYDGYYHEDKINLSTMKRTGWSKSMNAVDYIYLSSTHTHSFASVWTYDSTNHWRQCTGCTEISEKAAHSFNSGIVTAEPTYYDVGIKTYTCTVCDYSYTEEIPRLKPSGYCGGEGDGTNLSWVLDNEGTLTIKGKGKMRSYGYRPTPWSTYDWLITSVVIDSGVTTIDDGAFYDYESLTSVTIPDSVTSIGDYAFYNCESLTSVTIPDSVTSIGEGAFGWCESLTSVTIPDSVTAIGFLAFQACDCLTGFTVDNNNPSYSSDSNGVLFNKDKTELIQYPEGNPRASYTIPGSVITIDTNAFGDCCNLTSVTIPDSVITIGVNAFRECYNLTSVTIPDSVTSIGEGAFYECISLTSATIGNSVTVIGFATFYDCWRLTSVTIPDSVITIDVNAFRECYNLTSVTIGSSVTTIGGYAFCGCRSLTSVTIPDSVITIGDEAFGDCAALTDIYYGGTKAQWLNIDGVINSGDSSALNTATIHLGSVQSSLPAPVVKVSNVASTGNIKVSWDAVKGASKYEVWRATSKSGKYSKISTTPKTSVTNTNNVTPGETYYYKVRALDDKGNAGEYSEIKSRTCDYAQPTVSVALNADGNPKLTWKAVDGASKYEVWRATSKSGEYSKISTTSSTSVTNTKNLTAGTTYYYKVRAIGSVSEAASAYSTVVNCTMPLAAPVVKVSNDAATGNIKLSWDKVNGAAKYEVCRATSKSGKYSKISTTTKTTVTNTSNVTPGKTYYYKVRALDANGKAGEYSEIKSRTCDYAQPVITLSNVASTGKIKVSWEAVEGAAKYEVWRATSKSGEYSKISTTSSTSVTNTKNTTAGKTYYYKVRAIGSASAATSAYSDVKSRTCDYAQPTVSVALSSGKPKLTWDKVDGASKYEVYRATSKTGTYELLKTTTGTSLTNTSAKKGTTYYYKVRAIGSVSGATSAYSTVVSIKATK